jgi:MATE family multidrug resistance protein
MKIKNPILQLALPNIVSNISVPLVGIVDLALMGHMESELHLNAIAVGGTIFSFVYMSFSFLRMTTTGFVAQAYGQNKTVEELLIFNRSLLLAFTIALILLIFQIPTGKIAIALLGANESVSLYALEYFHIRIFAAPATLGLYAVIGWFIGRQDTKTPLLLALIINIGNVLFNLYFVFVMGLKSDGVAWGTLIAQYTGFIIGIAILLYRSRDNWKYLSKKALLNIIELKYFFNVNRDIFIRTVLLLLALTFFTATSARMGEEILAVNTLLFQFFLLFSYFIDGFANAAEALVGKYWGAKKMSGLKPLIKKIFSWGIGISFPFSLIYFVFGSEILKTITDIPSVIDASKPYMIWIGLLPLLSFAAFVWDGVYVGVTAAKAMRNSMLVSTLLVYLPLYFVLQPFYGNHGLWMAFLAFLFSRGLYLYLFSGKYIYSK